jgi:hypothetical protein
MYLLITIDTEGDNAWAKQGRENSTRNARYLPRFQEICDHYGFKPTYLVSYEMARDPFFIEFGLDALHRNRCEIGLHPHPWNMPPAFSVTSDDMKFHPYMIEYPSAIIKEKVRILTDLLEETFSTKLYSHRAGKWAIDSTYIKILCEYGYRVDCSVVPYAKDQCPPRLGANGSRVPMPDYSMFSPEPYFLDEDDISKSGAMPFMEVPMTVLPNYGRAVSWIYYDLLRTNTLRRAFRGLFGPPVDLFRPQRRRHRFLKRVAKKKMAKGANYLMFMLHSSEFMPGCNPVFKNKRDIEILYEDTASLFEWLSQKDFEGVTCYDYYQFCVNNDVR